MSILIVTGKDDVHADAVIRKAERRTTPTVVRLNTDDFAENVDYTIGGPNWVGEVALRDSGRACRTDEVTAVWYRKPVPIRSERVLSLEPVRDFVNSEYEAMSRSLFGLLGNAFWVSDYWQIRGASQKLPNLSLAHKLGLRTPRTLVTSRSEDARSFALSCGWNVLAKPFCLTTFKAEEAGSSWDTFATKLDASTFEKLAPSLALAPVILQEYVDKQIELRVTIVGRHVFCTSIDSQQHAFAQQDWRAVDAEELAHAPYELPGHIQEKLLLFNRAFGLEFSTHDLIIDTTGEFVWLECNPNGQWLWIEELTGQEISTAILDLLEEPASHALSSWEEGMSRLIGACG